MVVVRAGFVAQAEEAGSIEALQRRRRGGELVAADLLPSDARARVAAAGIDLPERGELAPGGLLVAAERRPLCLQLGGAEGRPGGGRGDRGERRRRARCRRRRDRGRRRRDRADAARTAGAGALAGLDALGAAVVGAAADEAATPGAAEVTGDAAEATTLAAPDAPGDAAAARGAEAAATGARRRGELAPGAIDGEGEQRRQRQAGGHDEAQARAVAETRAVGAGRLRLAEHLARRLLDDLAVDAGLAVGVGAEHRPVAEQVDPPRHAARDVVDALQRLAVERDRRASCRRPRGGGGCSARSPSTTAP